MKSKAQKSKAQQMKLLAVSEGGETQKAYRLIQIFDCNTKQNRKILILASELHEMTKLRIKLTDAGLSPDISMEEFSKNIKKLAQETENRIKLCERPGYVTVNDALCYLTSNGEVLGESAGIAPMPYPGSKAFYPGICRKGKLDDWKSSVALSAVHSPYIMLALCSAFAGYCIYFTHVETGGFHLFGDSSKGKSTALLAAASVYGSKDYVSDWNITEAAIEELAESRNHGLLILDEVSLLDKSEKDAAQKMQKIVYMLGAEGGKQRASFYQDRKSEWRLNALSNGEIGLNKQAENVNRERNNGEKVRFIDIPVDCNNELGIFMTVPEGMTPSAYAEEIKDACSHYYGVSGRLFVTKLLKKSHNSICKRMMEYMNEFMSYHNVSGDNGIEKRIATRFALSYASGAIAAALKILPFSKKDIMNGISHCYAKSTGCHKEHRVNDIFKEELILALTGKIKAESLPPKERPVLEIKMMGKDVIAVNTGYFKIHINDGYDYKNILSILKARGILMADSEGKLTRPVTDEEQKTVRRYCLVKKQIQTLLADNDVLITDGF